jgi:hypothetical protein
MTTSSPNIDTKSEAVLNFDITDAEVIPFVTVVVHIPELFPIPDTQVMLLLVGNAKPEIEIGGLTGTLASNLAQFPEAKDKIALSQ